MPVFKKVGLPQRLSDSCGLGTRWVMQPRTVDITTRLSHEPKLRVGYHQLRRARVVLLPSVRHSGRHVLNTVRLSCKLHKRRKRQKHTLFGRPQQLWPLPLRLLANGLHRSRKTLLPIPFKKNPPC